MQHTGLLAFGAETSEAQGQLLDPAVPEVLSAVLPQPLPPVPEGVCHSL